MGTIVQLKPRYSYVSEELLSTGINEKIALQLIEDFLYAQEIYTLDEVDTETAIMFYTSVSKDISLTHNQRKHFASSLEIAIRLHRNNDAILDEFDFERSIKNKLNFFLAINGIKTIEEITPALRVCYEDYLKRTDTKKAAAYLKAMDIAKLTAIEKTRNDFRPHVLRYDNSIIYLTYHPNIDIAKRFEYTANKEPLFFDFTAEVSETLKKQVFALLKHFVEEKTDASTHFLLQNCITPLWDLYNYCIQRNIADITRVKQKDINGFQNYQKQTRTKPSTSATAIIGTLRKHAFINNTVIDWDATGWYMERFHLNSGRMNPARPIDAFYFEDITNEINVIYFKQYMKYLIGLSERLSITSIYASYQCIKQFLSFLDDKDIDITGLNKGILEEYIKNLYLSNNKGSTTNRYISQIEKYLEYLETKGFIKPVDFFFEKYKVTEIHTHNDISVSPEDQQKVFDVLDKFPEILRLMFLNLWCIGLRINEVCTIRGNAYLFDGNNAWFLIYQNKAKREKRVPIPIELYELMTEYIGEHHIKPNDYVFTAPNASGPYRAGTFVKQVNSLLQKLGVSEEYHFKSHGYRHTLATELYMDGINIQCIREYLGHASENMTRQYIDHLPNQIDRLNDKYFKEKNKEDYQW